MEIIYLSLYCHHRNDLYKDGQRREPGGGLGLCIYAPLPLSGRKTTSPLVCSGDFLVVLKGRFVLLELARDTHTPGILPRARIHTHTHTHTHTHERTHARTHKSMQKYKP